MEILKKWKERPIAIGEFEDLWEVNTRFEVAKAYILLLKDVQSIPFEEKVEFFARVVGSSVAGSDDKTQKSNRELIALAAKSFLELVPTWNDKFENRCYWVLYSLGGVIPFEYKKGWEGKIKTFIHSFLNTHEKENDDFWNHWIPQILIQNSMFEELVNYDFTNTETIDHLERLLFGVAFDTTTWWSTTNEMLKEGIIKALKENREPHAISALLRLLAKRGELEKIFQVETE